jgi:capsular exopolysaccharide synthesis family protein
MLRGKGERKAEKPRKRNHDGSVRFLKPDGTDMSSFGGGSGSDKIELIAAREPQSIQAESYRSIRTALLLSSADNPVRTIAVTSAMPGEGKSVSVANLAVTLAQSGKTVLAVDADLRRPRQHRMFKVKNTFGLTTYLTDSVEIKDVVKSTEIPNLFLVNAGPLPPNPAELLGSDKMARFIRMMSEESDYVLFDLPPMLEISDALVLGAKVDGMVLVVWGDRTSREALRKAREKLDMLKVRTLGVIINNVTVPPHASYYYKDYYHRT